MGEEILNDNAQKFSWLDNITKEDVEEYAVKSKLIGKNSVFEQKVTFGVDDKGSKRIRFTFYLKGYTKPYVIMYFDEFGLVCFEGFREGFSSQEYLENLKIWQSIVRRANKDVIIDGKTYDEAFIEYYINVTKGQFETQINELEVELAQLKNKKIRAEHGFYRLVEENAEMAE